MIGSEIENMYFALKSCCNKFVHLNIFTIKLNTANTIFQICVPYKCILFHIKYFQISIIVTASNYAFFIIIRISKAIKIFIFKNYQTDQASGATSLSKGSKEITGLFYLGSHTLIHPSLPPVTISGAPNP
jgi:hypothetical protein